MFPHEELCFFMRKYVFSRGNTFPHEEACFLMRKHISSWGNMFPSEEAHFLMRKYISSWGITFPHEVLHFLMRKHVSSWGSMFPCEEECFLMRYIKKCLRFAHIYNTSIFFSRLTRNLHLYRMFHYYNCFLIALWFLLPSGSFREEYIPLGWISHQVPRHLSSHIS